MKELLLKITSLLALALLAFFLVREWSKTPNENTIDIKPKTNADYFLQGVSITRFDKNGEQTNQINAEKIEHFKIKNYSLIDAPNITLSSSSNKIWHLQASSGTLDHQSDNIELLGKINITQENEPSKKNINSVQPVTQIKTTDLQINLNSNKIVAENAVEVGFQNLLTKASGMIADIKNDQIKLTGKVSTQRINHEKK